VLFGSGGSTGGLFSVFRIGLVGGSKWEWIHQR